MDQAAGAAHLRKGRPRSLLDFHDAMMTRSVLSIRNILIVLLHIIYASLVGVRSTEKSAEQVERVKAEQQSKLLCLT